MVVISVLVLSCWMFMLNSKCSNSSSNTIVGIWLQIGMHKPSYLFICMDYTTDHSEEFDHVCLKSHAQLLCKWSCSWQGDVWRYCLKRFSFWLIRFRMKLNSSYHKRAIGCLRFQISLYDEYEASCVDAEIVIVWWYTASWTYSHLLVTVIYMKH